MSRTDHHRPWQIRAEDLTVTDGQAYYRHNAWAHIRTGNCDEGCGWTLPYRVLCQPPHDYVHGVWYGPERQRERTALRQMVQEYNAAGDLADGDFPNYQHRHCAHWLWS